MAGEGVITVAPTGSGKSLTYWIPLLYIKHGITVVVSPLKLLGTQFVQMLKDNQISVISIMVANATNELFKVTILMVILVPFLIMKGQNLMHKQYQVIIVSPEVLNNFVFSCDIGYLFNHTCSYTVIPWSLKQPN